MAKEVKVSKFQIKYKLYSRFVDTERWTICTNCNCRRPGMKDLSSGMFTIRQVTGNKGKMFSERSES